MAGTAIDREPAVHQQGLMEKHGKREPYRLYEKRERLVETLRGAVIENKEWLMDSLPYPMAKS